MPLFIEQVVFQRSTGSNAIKCRHSVSKQNFKRPDEFCEFQKLKIELETFRNTSMEERKKIAENYRRISRKNTKIGNGEGKVKRLQRETQEHLVEIREDRKVEKEVRRKSRRSRLGHDPRGV